MEPWYNLDPNAASARQELYPSAAAVCCCVLDKFLDSYFLSYPLELSPCMEHCALNEGYLIEDDTSVGPPNIPPPPPIIRWTLRRQLLNLIIVGEMARKKDAPRICQKGRQEYANQQQLVGRTCARH